MVSTSYYATLQLGGSYECNGVLTGDSVTGEENNAKSGWKSPG